MLKVKQPSLTGYCVHCTLQCRCVTHVCAPAHTHRRAPALVHIHTKNMLCITSSAMMSNLVIQSENSILLHERELMVLRVMKG